MSAKHEKAFPFCIWKADMGSSEVPLPWAWFLLLPRPWQDYDLLVVGGLLKVGIHSSIPALLINENGDFQPEGIFRSTVWTYCVMRDGCTSLILPCLLRQSFSNQKKNPSGKWQLLKLHNCSALGYFLWFIWSDQQTHPFVVLFIQQISILYLPYARSWAKALRKQ